MRYFYLFFLALPLGLMAQNKVGVNTDNPQYDLDVRGTDDANDGGELQLATPTETNFLRFFGGRLGDHHPFMAFHDDDTFHIVTTLPDWSTYTRRMTLLPSGEVGIGTDLPLSKLDIMATGDGAELLRLSTERPWVFKQRSNGVSTTLALQSTVDSKNFEILSQDGMNRSAVFFTNNIFSNVLLVPDNGEVGVGVPEDPTAKLHVRHDSNIGWPQLRLTEIGEDYARMKMENDANPGVFWDIASISDSVLTNSRINFYYSGPNGTGDRMTILGNGNVGIGTTNPVAKLDIVGGDWDLDSGNPGDLRIGNSAANAFRIGVATGGGGAGTARMYSQGGSLMLGTNNVPRLTITTAGNIGVGTTNPGNKVRIVGDASSTQNVLSVSNAYVGSVDVRAVEGFSTTTNGYGYGGYFEGGYRGVRANGQGGSYAGLVIGLGASSYGTTGTRTGLFARATGGSTNWAGYFAEGNVYITNELRIGSGASGGATGYKVAVDGKIMAEGVRVQLSQDWPDYVFDDTYQLMSLEDLETSIDLNKHLPDVPSASQIKTEGIDLGKMQTIMMQKIEELTLHMIEMHKRIEALEDENNSLRSMLNTSEH